MQLTKHHGLGNDFLVTFVDAVPDQAADLARHLCHRTRGVGADGLIFATPAVGGDAEVAMHLLNADGSAAAISGNGIRCLAQAVWRRHGEPASGAALAIESGGRTYRLDLVEWTEPHAAIAVDMGSVVIDAAPVRSVDLARPGVGIVHAATASVGNPHLVMQVDRLASIDIASDGPAIEAHWMPGGINVHFMVVTGPDAIELVHWERGAGATEACGSGATASAAVANNWGLVGDRVRVTMPGGTAEVIVGDQATLVGPSVHIADIHVEHIDAGRGPHGVAVAAAGGVDDA